MLSRFVLKSCRTLCNARSVVTAAAAGGVKQSNFFVFPRQEEGNDYSVNWSLVEDGVTSVGASFRNARMQLLLNRVRATDNKKFVGAFNIEEAGQTLDHDDFNCILADVQKNLSNSDELFVEDGFVGAHSNGRTGIRLISNHAADALFLRNAMIPTAPTSVDPRARCNGWNFDRRWATTQYKWDGQKYDVVPVVSEKGQRPVVVYRGLPGSKVLLQFIQNSNSIVGANIIVGDEAPLRAIVDSVGHAAAVVNSSENSTFEYIPCAVVYNGKSAALLLNAGDDILSALTKKNLLYSAYHSAISANGVTAIWNGVSVSSGADGSFDFASLAPDNMIPLPTRILSVASSSPTLQSVVDQLAGAVNEKSKPSLESILSKMSLHSVATVNDIETLLK